jgi:hypothetical protein
MPLSSNWPSTVECTGRGFDPVFDFDWANRQPARIFSPKVRPSLPTPLEQRLKLQVALAIADAERVAWQEEQNQKEVARLRKWVAGRIANP